ncbi:MAG: hypothetical protein ACKOSQ_11450 [Planctomycetaceae bacterium]
MTATWHRGVLRDHGGDAESRPLIVKIGGSLLGRTGWADAVRALVASLPAPRVLVVGGGAIVDGLRTIDAAEPQPPDVVHRLAIDCMAITARLVAASLGAPIVAEPAGAAATAVLDAPVWLAHVDRFARLPVGWHVTSDSIAALVAAELGATLLLVKSVAPPHDDIGRLAATGWVDAWFPTAARGLAHVAWAAPG